MSEVREPVPGAPPVPRGSAGARHVPGTEENSYRRRPGGVVFGIEELPVSGTCWITWCQARARHRGNILAEAAGGFGGAEGGNRHSGCRPQAASAAFARGFAAFEDQVGEGEEEGEGESDCGQDQGGKSGVVGDQPEARAGEGEGGELDQDVAEEGRRLRHTAKLGAPGGGASPRMARLAARARLGPAQFAHPARGASAAGGRGFAGAPKPPLCGLRGLCSNTFFFVSHEAHQGHEGSILAQEFVQILSCPGDADDPYLSRRDSICDGQPAAARERAGRVVCRRATCRGGGNRSGRRFGP